MITKNMTITDVVKAYPNSIELLKDFHIDYCCGGNDKLEDAVRELGLDPKSFIDLLNKKLKEKVEQGQGEPVLKVEQLMAMEVNELIDYIILTHHGKERNLIQETDELMNKVLLAHYERHTKQLVSLHALFSDLRKELLEHFAKEEKLIFPYMKNDLSQEYEYEYVKELENEHEAAGNIIKEIEACTNHFTLPANVCNSYRLLFQKLQELIEDIYIHIFTENSILFPKYEGGIKE